MPTYLFIYLHFFFFFFFFVSWQTVTWHGWITELCLRTNERNFPREPLSIAPRSAPWGLALLSVTSTHTHTHTHIHAHTQGPPPPTTTSQHHSLPLCCLPIIPSPPRRHLPHPLTPLFPLTLSRSTAISLLHLAIKTRGEAEEKNTLILSTPPPPPPPPPPAATTLLSAT